MAGEAGSGRYSAARHAVADGDGHRPASDDRSLVDRLLAGGDEQAFDWGWGEPADREPLHDIPELWDERRDAGGPRDEDESFPTPRRHGEHSLADDRADGGKRDWSDRGGDDPGDLGDDRGSDDWAAPRRDEDRRPDADGDRGADDAAFARPFDDLGPDRRDRPAAHGADDRRYDEPGFARPAPNGGGPDGDPLDALATGRVRDGYGPLTDADRDRGAGERDRVNDGLMDGEHAGDRPGDDPLGPSPLAPQPSNRDPFDAERSRDEEPADRASRERGPSHHALFEPEPPSSEPQPQPQPQERKLVDADPRLRRWADRGRPSGSPRIERPVPPADEAAATDPLGGGRGPERADAGTDEREDLRGEDGPGDGLRSDDLGRGDLRRDDLRGDDLRSDDLRSDNVRVGDLRGGEDRLEDQRGDDLFGDDRRGEHRGSDDAVDHRGEDRPDELFGSDRRGSGPYGRDPYGPDAHRPEPHGPDRYGAEPFGAGPDHRERPEPGPRGAELFADPALGEGALTGRIHITEPDDTGRPQEGAPAAREAPEPFDLAPDPTTAFAVVAPGAAPRRGPEGPSLEEYAARRRAAEQAAASAEEAAASAAERASAAIAAAARAAEEAEAAAEAAAKAAEKASEAAAAEERALAEAAARGGVPARQNAPEPPTQAVPLIAPARPGRRPPPRRPAGPPPRGARPDERPGPPPPTANRNAPVRGEAPGREGPGYEGPGRDGPGRDGPGREGPGREGPGRGGSDGEATAVLTGLNGLREPGRPRRPEPTPAAEATTVTPRRQIAEQPGREHPREPGREPHREPADAADVDHDDHDKEPEEQSLVSRLTSRPVVAAVGVGAVLAVAAIVAFFTTSEPEATPTEPAPAAVSAPAAQPEPTVQAIDLRSDKAVAFLTALRDADIPTSSSGQAEVEAADAICSQLDQGADEAQLARSVPAVLPNVTRRQASDVVDYAQQHYC